MGFRFTIPHESMVDSPEGFLCSISKSCTSIAGLPLPPHLQRGNLVDSETPGIRALAQSEQCRIVHSGRFSADLSHTQHSNQSPALGEKLHVDK